ncbi:PIR Superfamily Protein [Plasmodium ovale wallikeri]|uniref:PIR Superfamily Protein n=1 Tax=Plasmodium ovale wallikeri TaxID=864142 RepID=A0A1A9ADN4_PLAOA|nr:PIR Superfamily Protein [Plasmodium ovale wallikeri]SBT58668.1 PIR Superfamily Protein [Plasmodium ovale wallikeri]
MGTDAEEDEEEGYIPGDNYYSSVNTFLQYKDEFNRVTNEDSDSKEHGVDCKKIHDGFFSSNGFSDRCDKVAKYLYYIKEKDDNDNRCRCLNYLLNTKTEFNAYPSKTCPDLFDAYEEISDYLETCKSTITCIKKEDLGKIGKLYYLNESMKKLEKSITDNDTNIYDNAEQFAQLYKSATTDCQNEDTDGYCGAVKDLQVICDYHTNSKNCAEIDKLLKYQIELKKAIKISVPCIIILSIPLFLYILNKFTSVGSWYNNILIKNKIFRNNMNEEVIEQFFEQTYEIKDRDSNYRLHNIGYHVT